jgi:hypothetical protein
MTTYNHRDINRYSIEQLEEFISSGQVPPDSGAFQRIKAELDIRNTRESREEDKKIKKIAFLTLIFAFIATAVGIISLFI